MAGEQLQGKKVLPVNERSFTSSDRAKGRWKLLSDALKKQKKLSLNEPTKYSIRRFQTFNLFDVDCCEDWQKWKLKTDNNANAVEIRCLVEKASAHDLIGFNNTGNICIWPSEEVLAYYILKHKEQFQKSVICELGAGMSGLAGLQVAANISNANVLITDGNSKSVSNLEMVVKHNKLKFPFMKADSRLLLWGDISTYEDLHNKFDFVICADCLFFVDSHQQLLDTVTFILREKGTCMMFAPRRSKTLDQFVCIAKQHFEVEICEIYDKNVTELHHQLLDSSSSYSEDLHYPLQVTLTRF